MGAKNSRLAKGGAADIFAGGGNILSGVCWFCGFYWLSQILVPLTWERFDLALRQRDYFRPGPQALFRSLRTTAFRERAYKLGGYDVSGTGDVLI